MTKDATSKDSNKIKIKMDTYTRKLYEDFISALSDRLKETADNSLSELTKINKRLDALSKENDKLTKQVKTNQALLIWILTPWYKKIFRRKNGKPQVLAKKTVVEQEDN